MSITCGESFVANLKSLPPSNVGLYGFNRNLLGMVIHHCLLMMPLFLRAGFWRWCDLQTLKYLSHETHLQSDQIIMLVCELTNLEFTEQPTISHTLH